VFISPAVQVQAADASGAVLPGVSIAIGISSGPIGSVLSGTTTQTTDSSGVATFNDLSINTAGVGYTLRPFVPFSGVIAAVISNSFNINAP
jgi:hypothetical protein